MVGCGVIGSAFGVSHAEVMTQQYPGYANATAYNDTQAVVSLNEASGVLVMRAVVSGVQPDSTGGIHIHSGFECSANGEVTGGHYYAGLGVDPWTTTYTANSDGVGSCA